MTDMNKFNAKELEQVTGGINGFTQAAGRRMTVSTYKNHHAFRTSPICYDNDETDITYKRDYVQVHKNPESSAYVCPNVSSSHNTDRNTNSGSFLC